MNSAILSYLLKSGGCLLAFYLLYLLLLQKETCFQYNRVYLLFTSGLSFLLPLLEMPAVQKIASIPAFAPKLEPIIIRVTTATSSSTPDSFLPSWDTLLLIGYSLGVGVFAFRLLRQFFFLQKFIRQHQHEAEVKYGIKYVPTHGQMPTFSIFRYIFWDNTQTLSSHDKERILQHERAHVQQGHSYDLVYLELLLTIFWFNPVLHLFRKALMTTHEFLADAHVIQTEDKTSYSLLLANQVLQKANFSIGNYFNKSLTLKRLKMMQKPQRPTPVFKLLVALPLMGALLVGLSSNTMLPEQKAQHSAQAINHQFTEPEFPGGKQELKKFIINKLRYPASASTGNEYGNVFIKATVQKDGTVGNFEVVKASHPSLKEAAMKALENMPKWAPGKVDGNATTYTYLFPFSFRLDGFKNNLDAMDKEYKRAVSEISGKESEKVSNQSKSNKEVRPFSSAPDIVVVGYGPVE